MKGFTVAAILGLMLSASAQTAPSPPIESVIVTAPAQRPEDALNNFIISHAAPTPLLDKIARWKTGVCPLTLGLPDKLGTFINQRIIRTAMTVGAPLDSHEPCRPNLLVLATDQPQALLDFVRTKRPDLLGFHYRSKRQQLAVMRRPIQAWYSTATEDFYGFISADLPSWDLGYGVMSTSYNAFGFAAPHVSGNRTGNGLKSELTAGIIIVDKTRIAGQQIGALADYIAMLALSQAQSYDDCQPVPTINNLLAPACDKAVQPEGLTDIDATYLRGLYKMDPGGTLLGERASIAFQMKKELGGY